MSELEHVRAVRQYAANFPTFRSSIVCRAKIAARTTRHCLQFVRLSYIKYCVRPRKQNGRYASFYAPVKDFLEFDSISTIRQSAAVVWQRTRLLEDSLTPIRIVAIRVTLTQWLDSTIYEDKGAQSFHSLSDPSS
jgi:hypothetical protein